MHVASFTEAEEAALPTSYQMVEDFLRSLMEEVKARTIIMAEIILFCGLSVLFSFLLCESHCRPNNFGTFIFPVFEYTSEKKSNTDMIDYVCMPQNLHLIFK